MLLDETTLQDPVHLVDILAVVFQKYLMKIFGQQRAGLGGERAHAAAIVQRGILLEAKQKRALLHIVLDLVDHAVDDRFLVHSALTVDKIDYFFFDLKIFFFLFYVISTIF